MTTICPILECANNSRLEAPRCKLAENEVNRNGYCVSLKIDAKYLTHKFSERRKHIRKLQKENLKRSKENGELGSKEDY